MGTLKHVLFMDVRLYLSIYLRHLTPPEEKFPKPVSTGEDPVYLILSVTGCLSQKHCFTAPPPLFILKVVRPQDGSMLPFHGWPSH